MSVLILASIIALSKMHSSYGYAYNYSCADWMANADNDELDDGYYDISLASSSFTRITVYCHFNYTSHYAWTLIESFDFNYYTSFNYYAFYESLSYSESYVETSRDTAWRIDSSWMKSIFESMAKYNSSGRKMISTCNFNTDLSQDFLVINLDDPEVTYNPLYDYWSSYACIKMENINIRGYQCKNKTVNAHNNGYHFYVDSDYAYCDCYPWYYDSVDEERNFGYYYYRNYLFSCTASDLSTTNWWLGGYIKPTNTITEIEKEFVYFSNVTCSDFDSAYENFEYVSLGACLAKCENNKCRFVVYMKSQKGSNDKKCFLFHNWCQFESHSNGNSIKLYVRDYELKYYDTPSDWIDKYRDNCDDYVTYDWCDDGIALKDYQQFYESRDVNGYNLTAIDVCGECSGGLGEYNTNIYSLSFGVPSYQDLNSLVHDNDHVICYQSFQDMFYSDNYNINNNSTFGKVSLYSMCTQYITKLSQYYSNKNDEKKLSKLQHFDCNVFSLVKTDMIRRINISICQIPDSDPDEWDNSDLAMTNFVFGLGVRERSPYTHNVYLNPLWVDIDSIKYLANDYEIFNVTTFKECNSQIYDESIYSYTAVWLPCNITITEESMRNDSSNSSGDNGGQNSKYSIILIVSIICGIIVIIAIVGVVNIKRKKTKNDSSTQLQQLSLSQEQQQQQHQQKSRVQGMALSNIKSKMSKKSKGGQKYGVVLPPRPAYDPNGPFFNNGAVVPSAAVSISNQDGFDNPSCGVSNDNKEDSIDSFEEFVGFDYDEPGLQAVPPPSGDVNYVNVQSIDNENETNEEKDDHKNNKHDKDDQGDEIESEGKEICQLESDARSDDEQYDENVNVDHSNENNEDLNICTICQEKLNSENMDVPITILGCKHSFHEPCWDNYKTSLFFGKNVHKKAQCPNCRQKVYTNDK